MFLLAMIVLFRIVPKESIVQAFPTKGITVILATFFMLLGAGGIDANAQDFSSDFNRSDALDRESDVPPTPTLKSRKNEELLREGTLIPPTTGTIVPVGRRWGFSPDDPEMISRKHLESGFGSYGHSSSGLISKPRPTRLGMATVSTPARSPEPPLEETANIGSSESEAPKVKHIILAENLMLQRIVEAVIADSADDRWTISGEITEFRNQNRLRINTAQRTNER